VQRRGHRINRRGKCPRRIIARPSRSTAITRPWGICIKNLILRAAGGGSAPPGKSRYELTYCPKAATYAPTTCSFASPPPPPLRSLYRLNIGDRGNRWRRGLGGDAIRAPIRLQIIGLRLGLARKPRGL
jgi:hypothetical protein